MTTDYPADGGPAFPNITSDMPVDGHPGMSLLDYYAGKAMEENLRYALNSRLVETGDARRSKIANEAYLMAEEMIKAKFSREQSRNKTELTQKQKKALAEVCLKK